MRQAIRPQPVTVLSGDPAPVRRSPAIDDLAAILDPDVDLAIWDRSSAPQIGSLNGFETICLTSAIDRIGATLAAALTLRPPAAWHAAMTADIAALARRFAAILRLARVTVRLERVTGDACRRWHADYVSVRLICTYCGSGTQWTQHATATPQSLATGAVGLFKGRLLAGERSILHRSPPIAGTGEERLLLVLDAPSFTAPGASS